MKKALMIVFTIACTLQITAQERQKNPEIYNAYTLAKAMSSLEDSLKSYQELKVLIEKGKEIKRDLGKKNNTTEKQKTKEKQEKDKEQVSLTQKLNGKQVYLFSILSQIMAYAEIEKFDYPSISKKLEDYKNLHTIFEKIAVELNNSVKIISQLDSLNKIPNSDVSQFLNNKIKPESDDDKSIVNKIINENESWKKLNKTANLKAEEFKLDSTNINAYVDQRIICKSENCSITIKDSMFNIPFGTKTISINLSTIQEKFKEELLKVDDSTFSFSNDLSGTVKPFMSQLILTDLRLTYNIDKQHIEKEIEKTKVEINTQYDKLSSTAKINHSGFSVKSTGTYVNFEQIKKETQASSSNTITYNLTSPEASSISFKMPSEAEMIDAMAIYLATRVKQEAVLWFFETMRNNTENFELIQTAFPETMSLLQSEETYSTPNLGPSWKYALSKDFVKMPQHILESEWLRLRVPEEHQYILGFLKISYDISRYVSQNFSYRDIISQLYMNKEKYNHEGLSIQAMDFLNILYAFSTELNVIDTKVLKAKDPEKESTTFRPLSYEELRKLTADEMLVMLSLLDLKYGRSFNKILPFTENTFPYEKKEKAAIWMGQTLMTIAQFENVLAEIKEMREANKGKENADSKFNYYSVWNLMSEVLNALTPNDDFAKILNTSTNHYTEKIKLVSYSLKRLKDAFEIYDLLEQKNYAGAVSRTLTLVDTLLYNEYVTINLKALHYHDMPYESVKVNLTNFKLTGNNYSFNISPKERNALIKELKINQRQERRIEHGNKIKLKKPLELNDSDKNNPYYLGLRTKIKLTGKDEIKYENLTLVNSGKKTIKFYIQKNQDGKFLIYDLNNKNNNKNLSIENVGIIPFNSKKYQIKFSKIEFLVERTPIKNRLKRNYETYKLKSKGSSDIKFYYRAKRLRNTDEKMLIPQIIQHPEQWQGELEVIMKGDSIFKFPTESLAAAVISSNDKKALQIIRQVSNFLGDVSMAKDSKALSKVIESYALPPGSFKKKRSVWYSWDLNAFAGAYVGYESKSKFDKVSEKSKINDSWVAGFSAPIGISYSFNHGRRAYGYSNMNTAISKNPDGLKITKRKAYTLNRFTSTITFSIVDIGAAVSFRLQDSETVLSPKFKWEQFISPGIHYSLSIPNTPLVVQAGFQITPEIRRIEKTDGSGESYQGMFRTYAGLFFDLPLYNIYSKTRKVKHEIGCIKRH